MKLRTQLSLFSALLVSSVVAATTGGFYFNERERLTFDFQEERAAIAKKLELVSVDAIIGNDYAPLIRYVKDLKLNYPEIVWAGVHHAGEFVAHSDPEWIGKSPADQNTLKAISSLKTTEMLYDSPPDILEVVNPIRSGNARIGTARIAFSYPMVKDRFNKTLLKSMNRIMEVAIFTLIFGVIAGLLIAQNITRRLSRLVRGARSLAKGNFQEKISLAGADEIQELASEFNLMGSQLAKLYGQVHEQADTLAQANLELLELDRIKKHFFSLVSHELRSPLTTIKGYLTILLDAQGMEDWEKQERQLSIIREETERIANMVNEFMDLSRIEAGTFKIEMRPIQVEMLIEFVADRIEPEAANHNVKFSCKVDSTLKTFVGDPDRLSQVLMNLIINSLKFTSAGGEIHLDVYRIPKGRRADDIEQIGFKIKDTGKGIPREALQKIFNRYYQVEGEEKKKGLGLGLAFAKEVIERHGGTIWAESEGAGKGSTFTFIFPLKTTIETTALQS